MREVTDCFENRGGGWRHTKMKPSLFMKDIKGVLKVDRVEVNTSLEEGKARD